MFKVILLTILTVLNVISSVTGLILVILCLPTFKLAFNFATPFASVISLYSFPSTINVTTVYTNGFPFLFKKIA
ncbi:hypothetical protein [Methanobrevibacter oralis]|uniref:hypothetical protein n=1 Tax=Methanobrevibacter oralis TaxID=66851 RepID=UPI0005B2E362|nr:hypothetical protein [Methanobrevibacter oralis]